MSDKSSSSSGLPLVSLFMRASEWVTKGRPNTALRHKYVKIYDRHFQTPWHLQVELFNVLQHITWKYQPPTEWKISSIIKPTAILNNFGMEIEFYHSIAEFQYSSSKILGIDCSGHCGSILRNYQKFCADRFVLFLL